MLPQIKVIKTPGSELWGQEEAGLHDKQVSYLHVYFTKSSDI